MTKLMKRHSTRRRHFPPDLRAMLQLGRVLMRLPLRLSLTHLVLSAFNNNDETKVGLSKSTWVRDWSKKPLVLLEVKRAEQIDVVTYHVHSPPY